MSRIAARFLAFALIPMFAAGCGKLPSTSVKVASTGEQERVVTYAPHMRASANPRQPVGVMVDGRWYAKGDEPTVAATPAPAAPQPGKGHLHVTVSLAGVSDFTDRLRLRLHSNNASDASGDITFDFTHDVLVGESVETTLTNVPAGSYVLQKDALNSSGGVISDDRGDVDVVLGKTVEASI